MSMRATCFMSQSQMPHLHDFRWRSAFWLEALLMAPFALFCLLAPPIDMRGPMAGVSAFHVIFGNVCQTA